MEAKDFVKDDFLSDTIVDNFDLLLYEDSLNDFYTVEEFRQEVIKRVIELNKIGYDFSAQQIVDYLFTDETDPTAATQSIAPNKYRFRIAKLAARKRNERFLDNIIYHELCHMLQLDYLFYSGMILYVEGKLKRNPKYREQVNSWLKADDGHTPLWYVFVHKVNAALAVNPPIDNVLNAKDLSDIFLENTFKPEYEDFEFDGFFDYFPEVMK